MKNLGIVCAFFLCLIVMLLRPTQAATISLVPLATTIAQGDPVSVEVNIADLGNFAPPSLGAFLVEVTFDSSILSFDAVSFGSFLGNPFDPFETDIVVDTSSPGVVSLDEFSFLFDFELDTLQPTSFTLATLTFTGSGLGSSALGFGSLPDLSDAIGNTITPTLMGTSITVQASNPPAVPEPSTGLLFATGFLGFLGYRWRRRRTA